VTAVTAAKGSVVVRIAEPGSGKKLHGTIARFSPGDGLLKLVGGHGATQ